MATHDVLAQMRENWPEAANGQSPSIIAIQRLAALLRGNAERTLAQFDLGFTEFETLAALRASAPPHELLPSSLYDAILISSGGLTKVLKALEGRELVSRPRGSGDARRRPIRLTRKGKTLAEKGMAAMKAEDARLIGDALSSDAACRDLKGRLFAILAALEGARAEERV